MNHGVTPTCMHRADPAVGCGDGPDGERQPSSWATLPSFGGSAESPRRQVPAVGRRANEAWRNLLVLDVFLHGGQDIQQWPRACVVGVPQSRLSISFVLRWERLRTGSAICVMCRSNSLGDEPSLVVARVMLSPS